MHSEYMYIITLAENLLIVILQGRAVLGTFLSQKITNFTGTYVPPFYRFSEILKVGKWITMIQKELTIWLCNIK